MPLTYDQGDLVHVAISIADASGAADPTTLTFRVTAPDAVSTTYTYSTDIQLVRSAQGEYYVDVSATQLGIYQYIWTSTGTAQAVESSYFIVRPAYALVGGQDVISTVRVMVNDTDSSNYEFSDRNLSILLSSAIAFYQRWRPYYKESTITLVANQADYALPSDCVRPIHIPYRTFSSDPTVVSLFGLNGFLSIIPYMDWTDQVLTRIQQEYAGRFEQLGGGQAEFITYLTSYAATRYLRLYPTPSAAGSFVLRYQANHPIQNNNYFTIPADHAIYIQKLLLAEVYDVRFAISQSGIQEFQAGTTRIKVGSNGSTSLGGMAYNLRQEVMDALSSPVGRVG